MHVTRTQLLRRLAHGCRPPRTLSTLPSVDVIGAEPAAVRNVWCIGRNYAAHARELHNAVPTEEPVLFLKASSACRPLSAGPVAFASESFHHEIEMVLLIGEHVPLGGLEGREPSSCVRAVGLGLDLTRRGKQTELKKAGLPWTLAKSFAGAALLSPFAPCDGSFDLADVAFELSVNGAVKQSGHVNQMIFDVPFQLRYISSFAPLLPGDLIFTGTPEGVGPLSCGDTVSLRWLRGPQLPAFEGVL